MYGNQLAKNLGPKGIKKGATVGRQLTPEEIDTFSDDQVNQLVELMKEAKQVYSGPSWR